MSCLYQKNVYFLFLSQQRVLQHEYLDFKSERYIISEPLLIFI